MRIIGKMAAKAKEVSHYEGVTIAFLGDSVTQGCFEVYRKGSGGIETVFDPRNAYERTVADIFSVLFPNVPVNIINAGISGDRAVKGVKRLERDVLRHEPDLTVVCYGLNDCKREAEGVSTYVSSLQEIFERVMAGGSELIFMTPNMMNTEVSPHLSDPERIQIAEICAEKQCGGVFDAYVEAARGLCGRMGVPVCDCYAIWKRLYESGVGVTDLLANKINHPTREMNKLFAYELVRTMFEET